MVFMLCDGRTDGPTDGPTDGQTDERTDERTYPLIETYPREENASKKCSKIYGSILRRQMDSTFVG